MAIGGVARHVLLGKYEPPAGLQPDFDFVFIKEVCSPPIPPASHLDNNPHIMALQDVHRQVETDVYRFTRFLAGTGLLKAGEQDIDYFGVINPLDGSYYPSIVRPEIFDPTSSTLNLNAIGLIPLAEGIGFYDPFNALPEIREKVVEPICKVDEALVNNLLSGDCFVGHWARCYLQAETVGFSRGEHFMRGMMFGLVFLGIQLGRARMVPGQANKLADPIKALAAQLTNDEQLDRFQGTAYVDRAEKAKFILDYVNDFLKKWFTGG